MTIALASLPDRTGDSYFIETLLQDKDGVIDDLIERYHTNELRSLFCQNSAVNVNRGNDVLIHNYADLPLPKINQLVIPTGATRWSYCLLLADKPIKERIDTASDFGVKQLNLIYGSPVGSDDEKDHIISLTVSVLTPRRVSPILDDDNNDLWLIPVVDTRYWWQFIHAEELSTDISDAIDALPDPTIDDPNPQFEPDDLEDLISEKLNEDIFNVGVCGIYKLIPICASENDNENYPVLMDSIYAHYGQRLVVDIGCWNGESYSLVNEIEPPLGRTRFAVIDGTNSQDVLSASLRGEIGLQKCTWNTDGPYTPYLTKIAVSDTPVVFVTPKIVAGNLITGTYSVVPASVKVQTYSSEFATIALDEILHPDAENPAFEDPIWKDLHVTSFQDVSSIWRTQFDENSEADSDIQKLKTQIARDYYYQFLKHFDYTIAGVQAWQQGYFDDFMVIRQTYNNNTKEYDAWTRVCSRQPNLIGEWTGVSDGTTIWAVNVGSLPTPTLVVVDGVVSGHKTGTAAILFRKSDGNLKITDIRKEFERWDDGSVIDDGTLIQIDKVTGKSTIVFANCAPTPGLIGLDATP